MAERGRVEEKRRVWRSVCSSFTSDSFRDASKGHCLLLKEMILRIALLCAGRALLRRALCCVCVAVAPESSYETAGSNKECSQTN